MTIESNQVVEGVGVQRQAAPRTLYTRNSTGFVRELSLIDQITYSWTASTPPLRSWRVPFCCGSRVHSLMAACQRGLFPYSFERLLPDKVAEVNERTHTPVIAIAITAVLSIGTSAWAAYGKSHVTLMATVDMFGYMALFAAGMAAIVMLFRRRDLYKGSLADWHPLGLPVLQIACVGCCAASTSAFVSLLVWNTNYAVTRPFWTAIAPFICFAVGLFWWYCARAARRKEGIDLDLIYKTIPPD